MTRPDGSISPSLRVRSSPLLALLMAGAACAAKPAGPLLHFNLSIKTRLPSELVVTLTAESRAPGPHRAQVGANETLRWAVSQLKPERPWVRFFVSHLATAPSAWYKGKVRQWMASGTITLRSRHDVRLNRLMGELETRLIAPTINYQPLGVNRARLHLMERGLKKVRQFAQTACLALGDHGADFRQVDIVRTPVHPPIFRPLLTMAAASRPQRAPSLPLVSHKVSIRLAFAVEVRCTPH